jgi:hypothetical protein
MIIRLNGLTCLQLPNESKTEESFYIDHSWLAEIDHPNLELNPCCTITADAFNFNI